MIKVKVTTNKNLSPRAIENLKKYLLKYLIKIQQDFSNHKRKEHN